MLDLNFVRDNLPLVEEKLRQRGMNAATVLKDFSQIDAQRRQAIAAAETIKANRNRASEEVARLKKRGENADALIAETKALREQIQGLEIASQEYDSRLQELLTGIPNLPHDSVPVGDDSDGNIEVRHWGRPPDFDFAPRSHWEIGERLGILDLERAAKISAARFSVYWDMGAKLERALANYMLDLHAAGGYTEVLPPYLVNSDSMYGTGQLPKFAADLFRVPHGEKDWWLIPTAEVPLTNL
ncbi:MAG: serine--tRNA ligase, partial [Acidobacteriales bacterium]|nr:serine--tRNA ligase [Terriglobales bacterium]